MKVLENKSITTVKGIKAAGIAAGLKKSGKKDLCVLYSEKKAVSAAAFTTNKVKAAPVLINMEYIKNDFTQVIIVNSGQANACTGNKGYQDALKIAKVTAEQFKINENEVLQASTGVIGVPIPMDIMEKGIKDICGMVSKDGGNDAAEAIMTTDTLKKQEAVEIKIGGKIVTIAGMSKGSGMIHPNMATTLNFVVTDLNITKKMLNKAMKESVKDSFNMISIDGDTSTNDMAIILANGMAENELIDCENDDYQKFKEALDYLNKELAKKIAKDGEGATRLIEVEVVNAKTKEDAKIAAKSVITSSLVKTALFGADANWGRIVCALGYSGAEFDPDKVDVYFKNCEGKIKVFEAGMDVSFDEELAKKILNQDKVGILADFHDGESNATAWGCDLTYEYVKINGEYRT